jgi:hypothetical protein
MSLTFTRQATACGAKSRDRLSFWLNLQGSDAEIKLELVALTKEQVERYNLPQNPISRKPEARRGQPYKDCWEDVHGGATELDAL